jgi:hypothetical protein
LSGNTVTNYSDVQKSVPVKLARLLLDITIGCCFDSHPRIDSVIQNSGFCYGLLENAIPEKTSCTTSDLLIPKPRFLSFFANIKQYRPELESLMTLKFHTLKHIGVCCLLRHNLAVPLIFMGQDCARLAILIHFFQK